MEDLQEPAHSSLTVNRATMVSERLAVESRCLIGTLLLRRGETFTDIILTD